MRRSTKTILAGGILTSALAAGLLAFGVAAPSQAATRSFLVICSGSSHSNSDDPILFPNQPGASHLHDFVGNRTTNAYSTPESLKGQASSCPNNDRSSYWVPALYQNGKKVPIAWFSIYYENRAMEAGPIQPFPEGFRMILGNSAATTITASESRWVFGCTDNSQIGGQTAPSRCDSGGIQIRSQWPNCWNGKRSGTNDSPNVRFSSGGKCPDGFKTPLPTMRMNVAYLTGTNTGNITLASGGGSVYSKHGDFFNAWDQKTLSDLVAKCLNTDAYCGKFNGTTPALAGVKPVGNTPAPVPATTAPKPPTSAPSPATMAPRPPTSAPKPPTTPPAVTATYAPTTTTPAAPAPVTTTTPTTTAAGGVIAPPVTRAPSAPTRSYGGVIKRHRSDPSTPWYRDWRALDRSLARPLAMINPSLTSSSSPIPAGVPIILLLASVGLVVLIGSVNHRVVSSRWRRLRAAGSHRR